MCFCGYAPHSSGCLCICCYCTLHERKRERERDMGGGEKVSKANCYLFHEVLNDWKLPDTICFPCKHLYPGLSNKFFNWSYMVVYFSKLISIPRLFLQCVFVAQFFLSFEE